MRLLITFEPKEMFLFKEINPYFIHSFIWNTLKSTDFSALHDKKGFKFFTFSNIFPLTDFMPGENKNLIISSPNRPFLKVLKEKLDEINEFNLGIHIFEIKQTKLFNVSLKKKWETGSPIVLYKDNAKNEYFSFKRHKDLKFFLERLKDNAIKKFTSYYKLEKFEMDEPIFDSIKLRKEVCVNIRKERNEFIIIGSLWKLLEKAYFRKGTKKFYRFIMDCGLGEKNSFGFGFVNPLR